MLVRIPDDGGQPPKHEELIDIMYVYFYVQVVGFIKICYFHGLNNVKMHGQVSFSGLNYLSSYIKQHV
jgi:hypothetical protein